MSEWLGKMLGKVRIDSLLARGGMAEVYLGEHVALQREVAVKILRNQYEDDPNLLERFQREARVVAKLRHSNIVQVFDFDSVDNRPYLVMEYIPGISLSRYLHILHGRNGRLELPIISRIITQVAHALQYAHESGVIHRDIKPGNILLTSRTEKVMAGKPLPGDFEPILTDFGLVRFLNSSKQTTIGAIAGTPAYMSPEQARGEPTDERTDIYSLGIVLYELLAGHIPFDGETTMSIILKQVTDPPPPIPGIPHELQHILNRALAKRPEDRYQTANELANVFAAYTNGLGDSETILEAEPGATTHITKVGFKEKPSTNNNRRWVPVLLAGAATVIFGSFFIFRNSLAPPVPTPTLPPVTESPATPTIAPSPTPLPVPPGVIHFQDGAAILDQASLKALAMASPPEGSHYEVWLTGGAEWNSLGILILTGGTGTLLSTDSAGANMISLYDRAYVTIELNSDTNSEPSAMIAYSSVLPPEGLANLRELLVASPDTTSSTSLIQGLNTDVVLIDRSVRDMQSAYQKGNDASIRQIAEGILNLLAGDQSGDHKDWNNDSQVTDASDGFGLFTNGEKPGYFQAVLTHTESAIRSLNATEHMIKHGEEVKVCLQNLETWTSQLQDLLTTIVTASPGTDLSQPVLDSVKVAEQLLIGVDADSNKSVDAISGECGMSSLYGYAYSMADMTLMPFDPNTILGTGTTTATVTSTPTVTGGPGSGKTPGTGGGSTAVPATPKPPNTRKPPTKTPKN